MNLYSRSIKLYFVFLLTLCVFACSDKTQLNVLQSVVQKKEVKLKEMKPGAAIKLISSSAIAINPNEKSSIEIVLETKEMAGELTIDLSPPIELDLLDTPLKTTINLPSTSAIKIPVTLLAVANGRYHLKILARINTGDAALARSLAVIIQVGPPPEKTMQLKKMSGENVISLPAQETISAQ